MDFCDYFTNLLPQKIGENSTQRDKGTPNYLDMAAISNKPILEQVKQDAHQCLVEEMANYEKALETKV